ncbi:MAG TPA: protein kinase [Candidatus Eisenbacteria bacterium]|nr:protein kinase [Candidatus Eisenbacteria bacterium]
MEQVSGFTNLEPIGQGGFSVVYRARQEHLGRMVALKVLALDVTDGRALERFQRECQLVGSLSGHPNIVTVYEAGTTSSGRPYLAMDYFEGGSLRDRLLREGPLPVAEVVRVGTLIAAALAGAHEAGILHRDVKPQNILVSRYGQPALADFGISSLVGVVEASARHGALTPHHAAPEILEGQPPTAASDIYSLGSTLYQLLAGRAAHQRDDEAGIAPLLMRIVAEAAPDIARSDVPPPVMAVVRRAMARRPEDRFDSALAFAEELRSLERGLNLAGPGPAGDGMVPIPPVAAPAGPVAPAPLLLDPPEQTIAGPRLPLAPTADGRTRRRWRPVLAGAFAGVALLGAIGLGARTILGRPAALRAGAASPAARPSGVVAAALPSALTAADGGTTVVLHWQLGPDATRYPLVVRQVEAGQAPSPVTVLQKGTRTTTLGGLDPRRRYCFSVGALVATGPQATVAWSQPVCIRGASPAPTPQSS